MLPDEYRTWCGTYLPTVAALDDATKAQLLADVTAAYQGTGIVSIPINADVLLCYDPHPTSGGGANDQPPGYWLRAADGTNVTSPWPDPWEEMLRYF